MNAIRFSAVVVVSSVLAFAAAASPKGHDGNAGHGHAKHSAAVNCPPGLAKKDPPCIPPGQAKKLVTPDEAAPPVIMVPGYGVGDILSDDYVVLADPRIFDPRLDVVYVRYVDYLYLIDRATAVVLLRLGPVTEWTWAWDGTDLVDAENCPPGLAKKDPPCIPPGIASQTATDDDAHGAPYDIGEGLPDGYTITLDPKMYAPNDQAQFVREGDEIYRADATTGEVLDEVGVVGKVIK